MKFKGIAIFFLKNIPKKQIQCNKSREGDPLTLLGHPLFFIISPKTANFTQVLCIFAGDFKY